MPWSSATTSRTRWISVAAALGIVERDRLAGEDRAPILPGDHGHLGLDAGRLALGFRQDLRGREPGVQLELELVGEQIRTDPPVVGRAGQDLVLEEVEVSIQGRDDRLRLSRSSATRSGSALASLKRSPS